MALTAFLESEGYRRILEKLGERDQAIAASGLRGKAAQVNRNKIAEGKIEES